jgi:pSer/pThr/pTyr-binding forkhead associated (FHA) protein
MLKIQFKDRRKPAMWLVDSTIKLGRDAKCDISIDDANVEAVHCELVIEQAEVMLNNLSKNKSVFVNDFPISDSQKLVAGDVLKFGETELEIIDPLQELNHPRSAVKANKTVIRPSISAWMLKANSAPLTGQFFQIKQASSIGRDDNADITIPLSFVSRIHANLSIKQDKLFIEDANSSNGTFVNNEQIKSCELQNNDVVRLDEFSFSVIGPEVKNNAKPRTVVKDTVSKPKRSSKRSTKSESRPSLASEKVFLHDIDKTSTGKIYEIVSKNNHLSKMLGHHLSTSETSVSARHVHLNETDLGWEVVNNGAADGLLINNKMQIRAILQDGDEITVGGTRLKFQSKGDVPRSYFVPKRAGSRFPFKTIISIIFIVALVAWGSMTNWQF